MLVHRHIHKRRMDEWGNVFVPQYIMYKKLYNFTLYISCAVCVCVEGGEYLKLIGILFFVKFRSPVKQTISERDDVKLLSEYVCSLSKTVITRNNGHSQ